MPEDPNLQPGAPRAKEKGCRCPVIDNGHGKGAYNDEKGKPVFWINEDCPLHNPPESPIY